METQETNTTGTQTPLSTNSPRGDAIHFADSPSEAGEEEKRALSGGKQDKRDSLRERANTKQDAPQTLLTRAHQVDSDRVHSESPKRRRSSQRRKVPVHLWLERPIAAELERVAKARQLSVSATGAALLEQALSSDLETQHASLIEPMVERAVRRQMRALGNRLVSLQMPDLILSLQLRQILVNILGRLPETRVMGEEAITRIKGRSMESARAEIRDFIRSVDELVQAQLQALHEESGEEKGA